MARSRDGDGRATPAKGQARQERQDADRRQDAGLPREKVEADDIPDDGDNR